MTEIEVATGAAIAAQGALHCARKRNQDDARHLLHGSRSFTCATFNAPLLDEAYNALELAVNKLFEAKDREARMVEP
jgi:hypothetical protein